MKKMKHFIALGLYMCVTQVGNIYMKLVNHFNHICPPCIVILCHNKNQGRRLGRLHVVDEFHSGGFRYKYSTVGLVAKYFFCGTLRQEPY